MVFDRVTVCMIIGLLLWLIPWPPQATTLHEVGKWVFVIAFAVWLGLFH